MEILSGGLAGANPITYAANAALILDASVNFGGTIAGFALGDFLDLRDISFNPGTTTRNYVGNTSSGTLTVSDGTHTASIALLGQYMAAQFNLASDGHGGTVVTDPPLTVATGNPFFLNPNVDEKQLLDNKS